MNKLDDFFKGRLLDERPDEDGWNVPSDDLWEAAKPHFPKKKSKRRGFFWIFSGAGILVLALIATYMLSVDALTVVESPIVSSNDKLNSTDKVILTEEITPIEQSITSSIPNGAVNLTSSTEDNNTLKTNNIDNTQTQQIPASKSKSLNTGSNSDRTVITNQESSSVKTQSTASIDNTTSASNQTALTKALTTALIQQTPETTEADIEARPQLSIAALVNKSSSPLIATDENLSLNQTIKILPKAAYPKYELGLSRLFLFANLLDGKNIADEGQKVIINVAHYRNVNINYNRWISRSWSITSGLYASDLKINLDLEVDVNVETTDFVETVNINSDQISSRGSNTDFKIELLDGYTITDNELLNLKGNVDLSIAALQVPIFITKHWYPRNWEFSLGIGPTVEYIWNKQAVNSMVLFRDDVQITKPISEDETIDSAFEYSIYSQFGIKYKLTKHINAAFHTRISISDPIFSGVDFGLNYRWNR